MPETEPLIPVFVPALANVLALAEKNKGSPLSAAEVEAARDKSVCIMMPTLEAAEMDQSRGFIDVNPENCWADWHRLRAQMVGGYLPKIILCIPGDDQLRQRCEPILRAERIEHEFRPHDDNLLRGFRSSSITWPAFTPEDFARIEGHTTVLYALSDHIEPAAARSVAAAFMQLGKRLLEAGGIAIKCDSSGISHPAARWSGFAETIARNPDHAWPALYRAYVVYPIGSPESDLYTCGMHLLGAPDLIVSEQALRDAPSNAAAPAAALFQTFALYLLMECPVGKFASGHTFSVERDAPRYRVIWEPCSGYPEDDYLFNPFGRWRFTLP